MDIHEKHGAKRQRKSLLELERTVENQITKTLYHLKYSFRPFCWFLNKNAYFNEFMAKYQDRDKLDQQLIICANILEDGLFKKYKSHLFYVEKVWTGEKMTTAELWLDNVSC